MLGRFFFVISNPPLTDIYYDNEFIVAEVRNLYGIMMIKISHPAVRSFPSSRVAFVFATTLLFVFWKIFASDFPIPTSSGPNKKMCLM